ncbi:MAG: serine O-acetyltransferase EpsC [Terrimicrobiaceae bacterium]
MPETRRARTHARPPVPGPNETRIIRELLDSYRRAGGLNHADRANLPSKRNVAALCEDLLQLLFPGFFSRRGVTSARLPAHTRHLVGRLGRQLRGEIEVSLRTRTPGHTPVTELRRRAQAVSSRFLLGLPAVRNLLRTDVEAALAGDPAARSREEIVLAYPGLEAIAIQRAAHLLYQDRVPLLPRIMTEWAHSRTGIDIHPGARLGSHFFIDHGTGVVIGETCVIGDRVKLYHGVTLGARSFQKDDQGQIIKGLPRHPQVEDDVVIYPNTIILGGDTRIGARSTIGANVFLMTSVPADTLLVRGEQVQRRVDKKQGRRGTVTVQLHQDEVDFII